MQLYDGEKCEIWVNLKEEIKKSRYSSGSLVSFRLDPPSLRGSSTLRDTDVEKFEKLCFTKSPLSLMAIGL